MTCTRGLLAVALVVAVACGSNPVGPKDHVFSRGGIGNAAWIEVPVSVTSLRIQAVTPVTAQFFAQIAVGRPPDALIVLVDEIVRPDKPYDAIKPLYANGGFVTINGDVRWTITEVR